MAMDGPTPWHELALATGGTVALALVGLAYVTWMLRIFRARGFVTRYS
jgi:ABC-2 type transport system permease protein